MGRFKGSKSRSSSNNRRGSRGRGRGGDNRDNRGDSREQYRSRQQVKQPAAPVELPEKVKAYGDLLGDGFIQMSFTLPMPPCPEARVAATQLIEKAGFEKVSVLHMEGIGEGFSFFVVYGSSPVEVDVSAIEVPKLEHPEYSFDEVNDAIKDAVGRKVTVIGACIGTDAHTVGIDAIFNMKGYMGHYGLERYPMLEAINLRAQVDVEVLAQRVVDEQADAVLVSRVVTQRDSHIEEFKKLLDALAEKKNVPRHLIKICGGPRVDHKLAQEIGYDAGFGPGTLPSQVASYICDEIVKRYKDKQDS